MFNFTVNNNQKIHPSGVEKPYQYNTYKEALDMARICYSQGQYDICYTGKFETIFNIHSTIGKLLKLLNSGKDVLAVDRIFKHDNKVYMTVDGERIQIGKLKQLENNEYVFMF